MQHAIGLDEFLHGSLSHRAAVLADLDGCLISGETLLPHVSDLMAHCDGRIWIVSNNSTETAAGLAKRLGTLGLSICPENILLAGEETLRAIALERPKARVALFCTPVLHNLALELGLLPDRLAPDIVFLARDTGFCFDDLARLVTLAHRGVPIRLTNPDPIHPAPDGSPVPETGALWAALVCAVPGAVRQCIGKPAPDMLRRALARAGVLPGAAVFIGDTAETDGAAARAAGIDFVLLRRPGARIALKSGAVGC